MSQNILLTTSAIGKVRVIAGWDNPLSEVYVNVFPVDENGVDEENPEVMFGAPDGGADEVTSALSLLNITLPEAMVAAIQADCDVKARNVFRTFNEDGSLA